MISPSIDICWRIAEAEAALAGFPVIEPAHFWIGVCKAVDLYLSALLDAAAPEWKMAKERIAADLSEVKAAVHECCVTEARRYSLMSGDISGFGRRLLSTISVALNDNRATL